VRNGTYNEQIVIGKVTGASATNKITFESESGDSTKVFLTYQVNSILNYVLLLKGAEHINFRKLWISSVYSSNITPSIVLLEDKAQHISFTGCKIGRPESDVHWYNGDYSIRVNTESNDLVFSGNHIGGTEYGIYVARTVEGLAISKNTFANNSYQDIFVYAQASLTKEVVIEGNKSILPYDRSKNSSIQLSEVNKAVVRDNITNRNIYVSTPPQAMGGEVIIERNTITNSLTGGITTSGASVFQLILWYSCVFIRRHGDGKQFHPYTRAGQFCWHTDSRECIKC
jgi:trimeric autotransporter adhesin